MKEMRRFATRYEKLADNYLAFVLLACIKICIKPYFSDTP
jgi:transposase